ncbi:MAG: substrate-binding domain-containing protein [Lentisphaeria bacterium]|nr:substrate-binding domain-containing protein [Lentisphaeria bacterium]
MNRGKPQKFPALAEQILRSVRESGLAEGSRLPSERELARRYDCSHLTVRKALKVLAGQGILHARPGCGCFLGPAGQSHETRRSDLIGFIFPDDEIFYYRIFAEVEKMAASNGLHPVVHLTGGSVRKENELLDYFERAGAPALIAVPNRLCAERYRRLQCPALFFDMRLPELSIPQIISDDHSGALSAVEQLILLGHTRIAHIGIRYDYTGEQRLNGYLDALRKYGLPVSRPLIRMNYPSREWGYHAARELFELKRPPTAVFCANDTIAAGVIGFCSDRGIAVPEQFSVTGFGDTPTAEYLDLSSVSQNAEQISGAICSNLLKLFNGEEIPPLTVIPTSAVSRGSVCPPRKIR